MRNSPAQVEEDLSAAHAGSRDALGRALQAYRDYLLGIAREEIDAALLAKGSASDIVQETFLEASRTFPRFNGQSAGELRAWLRCLLLRRVSKHGRRYRTTRKRTIRCEVPLETCVSARAGTEPVARVETPSVRVQADEEMRLLLAALERMPEVYRRVIQMRYQEGRTFEEIGSLMGRTPNAVRLLWLRAVERVKVELGSKADG
jgi:RNA polymerase sigma-70 factor (ECF subfamily)